jgi:hypothetical protein
MTDLTPREMLDAVRWALEETARQINQEKAGQAQPIPQPKRLRDNAAEEPSGWKRSDRD